MYNNNNPDYSSQPPYNNQQPVVSQPGSGIPLQQIPYGQPVQQQGYYQQNYYPQNQPYQQIYNQPQTNLIIQHQVPPPQIRIVQVVPSHNSCPACKKAYIPLVTHSIGFKAIIISLLLIFCFWPLFWLPCVMDDCKDREYRCSSCGVMISSENQCC